MYTIYIHFYETISLYCTIPFAWGYFEFSFFWGGRGHIFSILLYFLRQVRYVFIKFCKDVHGITHTKSNMACFFRFAGLF